MEVFWLIVIFLSVSGIVWSIYIFAYNNGKHEERMRLINILCAVPLDNTIPERKYDVMCAVNYIVNKLREE
jgi:type III secretion system FlhB-like substrate exporter